MQTQEWNRNAQSFTLSTATNLNEEWSHTEILRMEALRETQMSIRDIAKELGRRWRELTDAQKATYVEAAVASKAEADAKAARSLERQAAGKRPIASAAEPSAPAAGASSAAATVSSLGAAATARGPVDGHVR